MDGNAGLQMVMSSSVVVVEQTLSCQAVSEEEDHGGIALQPVLYKNVCCKCRTDYCSIKSNFYLIIGMWIQNYTNHPHNICGCGHTKVYLLVRKYNCLYIK